MPESSGQELNGKIAVVTGATRGVGRGIALVLGERGATVYVTGRTTEGGDGTIFETAELVTARGGTGIPVRIDHTVDDQVEALFTKVGREQGRLDILVNNVWGGYQNMEGYQNPFWEQPIWRWDVMFDTGARAHFVASRFAVPLMLPHPGGLIVNTSYPDLENRRGDQGFIVNIAKGAVNDLTRVTAFALREHRIAVVSVVPTGYVLGLDLMRQVYASQQAPGGIESLYREHPAFADGETPEYAGRAVAALAADGRVMSRSGSVAPVDDLAKAYGFTDLDGRRPGLSY